jgi:hypothetical protein
MLVSSKRIVEWLLRSGLQWDSRSEVLEVSCDSSTNMQRVFLRLVVVISSSNVSTWKVEHTYVP